MFHNVFSVSDTSRRAAVHVALEPIKLKVKAFHALCFKRPPGRSETLEEWVTKGSWWRGVVLSGTVEPVGFLLFLRPHHVNPMLL